MFGCTKINAAENNLNKPNLINIAIVAPLSKNYADYGKELLLASTQAIQDQKTSKLHLNIIPFDDECDPKQALIIAKNIVQDPSIQVVISHTCAANNLEANQLYSKHGILHIIPTATNSKITETGATNIFKICGKDSLQAQNISNFLAKNFANKRIAVLHSADEINQSLATQIQENLAIFSLPVILYQSINPQTFDNYLRIKNLIKKLKRLNIDLIFFDGFYRETALLVKYLHYNKVKLPLITSDSIATLGFIKLIQDPKIATGTIMSMPKMHLNKKLNLNGQAILGYTAMQVAYTAINNILPTNYSDNNFNLTGIALANWLHQNKVHTVLGEKSWDTNGDIIDPEFDIFVWDQNGNYLLLK